MLTNTIIEELKILLPGKIFISQDELQKHSGNLFYISNHSPEAICYTEFDSLDSQLVGLKINHVDH